MKLFQADVCYEVSDQWLSDMHISTTNTIEVFGDVYKQDATREDPTHVEARNVTVVINGRKDNTFFDDEFIEEMKGKIIENINR